jgi:hypothetical protein
MKIGNVHALLDVMVEAAKMEEAVSGYPSSFGADFINMARDLGVPEDKIIDAISDNAEAINMARSRGVPESKIRRAA